MGETSEDVLMNNIALYDVDVDILLYWVDDNDMLWREEKNIVILFVKVIIAKLLSS